MASQGVSVAQFGLATTPAMFMSCIIPGEAQANTRARGRAGVGGGIGVGVGWGRVKGGEVVCHTIHSQLVLMANSSDLKLGCKHLC